MITVTFRLDDPSQISDHQLEKGILDLFNRYNASITFAVIPFQLRNNKHHDDFEEYCNADNSPDHPSFTNLAKLELLLKVISDDSEIEIKSLNQITETPGDYIHAIKNHAWFLKQNWRIRKHLPHTMLLKYPLPILIIYLLKALFNENLSSKET